MFGLLFEDLFSTLSSNRHREMHSFIDEVFPKHILLNSKNLDQILKWQDHQGDPMPHIKSDVKTIFRSYL